MTTLTNLIERVERAEEGSAGLDLAIYKALNPEDATLKKWSNVRADMSAEEEEHWASRFLDLPRHTASLHAAIALVEKVLPGWYMMIDGSLMTSFEVSLTDSRAPSSEIREDVNRFFARGKTLPLAILAAFGE